MYGGKENAYTLFGEKPHGKGQLGRLGTEGRIRLKWITKKWDERAWTVLLWLVQVADCCENSNQQTGSVQCRQFLD
jgi:hypothetical protein